MTRIIVTILEGAEVRIGFYGRGGRDPPRGHFRGCRRPRGVAPEVDHDLRGQENPISPRTEESIGITFSEERSDDPYELGPLGMLVTYTHITPRDDCPIRKVMSLDCISHHSRRK